MFAVIDDKNKIVAYHDNKNVCIKYIKNSSDEEYRLIKIKDKLKNKINKDSDLYLVKYGNTYIQAGYLIYAQVASEQIISDNINCLEILYRILETSEMTQKERKNIEKTIDFIEKEINNDSTYTPSLKSLKEMKLNYERFRYQLFK